MDEPLLRDVPSNNGISQHDETVEIGQKSMVNSAADYVKSATSALTNGLNGLKVSATTQ
jgi:hypothetical protein